MSAIDYSKYPRRQLDGYRPAWVFNARGWVITVAIAGYMGAAAMALVVLDVAAAISFALVAWLLLSLRWYQP